MRMPLPRRISQSRWRAPVTTATARACSRRTPIAPWRTSTVRRSRPSKRRVARRRRRRRRRGGWRRRRRRRQGLQRSSSVAGRGGGRRAPHRSDGGARAVRPRQAVGASLRGQPLPCLAARDPCRRRSARPRLPVHRRPLLLRRLRPRPRQPRSARRWRQWPRCRGAVRCGVQRSGIAAAPRHRDTRAPGTPRQCESRCGGGDALVAPARLHGCRRPRRWRAAAARRRRPLLHRRLTESTYEWTLRRARASQRGEGSIMDRCGWRVGRSVGCVGGHPSPYRVWCGARRVPGARLWSLGGRCVSHDLGGSRRTCAAPAGRVAQGGRDHAVGPARRALGGLWVIRACPGSWGLRWNVESQRVHGVFE